MADYKCWTLDAMTEPEAKTIVADSRRGAAEEWGRKDYYEEEFEEIEVMVRDPDGSLWKFSVESEIEVSFYAGLEERVYENGPEPQTMEPA